MSADDEDGSRGKGTISPEERSAFKQRASEIGERLDEVKARRPLPSDETRARSKAMAVGFRIALEFVVSVALGGFIGWTLDRWLGTSPWLLIVVLICGFAAGLVNLIRMAGRMQAEAEALQRAAAPVKDDADER